MTDFAWTPDAAVLAVANYSGINLYEVQTRRLLRSLYPRGEGVVSIDFSPNGTWLAAGSRRGTEKTGYGSSIELWMGPDWRPIGVLFGQPRGLTKVAFSPNGRHFVAALTSLEPIQNNAVEFWNTTTWEITGTLNTGTVLNFAFSPDGKLLATTPDRYAITVWDLIEGERRYTLPTSFTGAVNSLAFSPDGTRLATGHYDGEIRIWDTGTGNVLLTFNDSDGVVESLAFNPDGTLLATGSSYSDNLVRLWSVETGDLLQRLEGHAHAVEQMLFSPDGQLLVTGSYDGSVRLWGVRP